MKQCVKSKFCKNCCHLPFWSLLWWH